MLIQIPDPRTASEPDGKDQNYLALMLAVVLNAIQDARGDGHVAEDARSWLVKSAPIFLALAGVDLDQMEWSKWVGLGCPKDVLMRGYRG